MSVPMMGRFAFYLSSLFIILLPGVNVMGNLKNRKRGENLIGTIV